MVTKMLDKYVGMMVTLELTTIVEQVSDTQSFYGELFQAEIDGAAAYMLRIDQVWMEVTFIPASARAILDIDDDGLVYATTIQVTVFNDYS